MLNALGHGASLWAALAISAVLLVFFVRSRLNYLRLPKLPPRLRAGAVPDCMVVIPARNEEASIARAVRSFPHDTVIVVDDHSEDGTTEAARQAGAGVLPAPDLPAHAFGKSNACAAGARVIQSRWILFTDADTWFEEGFLDSAVAYAEADSLSFLSFHLRAEFGSFAESVLVPCAAAFYFGVVVSGGDPPKLVNGQCLLVLREAYEFIGGHRAVLTSVVEDVKLAALAARHRLRFAAVRTGPLGHVRFHRDGLWKGFERNAARFMILSPWIGFTIFIVSAAAALWLPALAWLAMDRQWAVLTVFALLPSALLGPWYRNPLRALLAPLGICGMFFVIANGSIAALTGRQLVWKGRKL